MELFNAPKNNEIKTLRHISMAYTTPSFCAQRKHVTRRTWKESYAKSFKAGDRLFGASRQMRYGGEVLGEIELLEAPYEEYLGEWYGREQELYELEGFAYLEAPDIIPEHAPLMKMTHIWIQEDPCLWVIPFDYIEIDRKMKEKYTTEEAKNHARNKLFKALTGCTIKDVTPPEAYFRSVA